MFRCDSKSVVSDQESTSGYPPLLYTRGPTDTQKNDARRNVLSGKPRGITHLLRYHRQMAASSKRCRWSSDDAAGKSKKRKSIKSTQKVSNITHFMAVKSTRGLLLSV